MATYYKPQSPIQSGEDFIYPITTADQIMKSDKSRRLEQAGLIVADNSTKLDGKASSAYTQSVDGVIPNSAGNVPLNIVSSERYYNSYTAGGTGDVDYITDTFALVPIGTDKNPDLFVALGSKGSYAYVKTSFYSKQETTSRRYQVAYSYNSNVQRKAWRTYTSSGWQRWNTDAQFSDVPRFNLLDNSNFANPIAQAGLNGKYGNTAYLCDRWSAYGITGEQKNGYIKLTGSSASSRITQNLDGVAGKTVTVAAKVTGSGRVYVGVYYTVNGTTLSITKAVNAPNGIISARGTIPSNAKSIGFRIYPDNSGAGLSANVFWAALYEGSYTDETLPPPFFYPQRLEKLNLGLPVQPRNLLDNSDFTNPVTQAGVNGYHGSTLYPFDRWISWDANCTIRDGYITTGSPIDQRFPKTQFDGTKSYTAAIGLHDGTIIANSGVLSTGIGLYANAYFGIDGDYAFFRIGGGLNVVWAALYEGFYTAETLPPYVPKGYAAELVECQRYYHLYATSAARPSNGLDCCPPMRISGVTQGTTTVDGETRYYNSADL